MTEYGDEGTGPTVLLLHGWQDSLDTFQPLSQQLVNNFRLVSLDLPGFGNTDLPPQAWTVSDYANFVAHFVDKLQLKPLCLIGHSFGGRIILKGVGNATLSTEKIVLIAAAGVTTQTPNKLGWGILAKAGRAFLSIPPLSLLKESARKKLYSHLGSDYNTAGQLKETFLNVIGEDLSQDAQRITKPTLLIWGDADTATPLADGQRLNALMPNSKLEAIAGANHFVHQSHPQEVGQLIKTFLC